MMRRVWRERRDGVGDRVEVGAHEHDVGGVHRDVGARAHREPEVGLRQRGRVVDAVTDHGHDPARALQLGDDPVLVGGQHVGAHVVGSMPTCSATLRALVALSPVSR